MEYHVSLQWDEEASVWIATSQDVPGLVLESGSLDGLMEKVRYAVPELLGFEKKDCSAVGKIHFTAERYMEAIA